MSDAALAHVEALTEELQDLRQSKEEDIERARRKIQTEPEAFNSGSLDRLWQALDYLSRSEAQGPSGSSRSLLPPSRTSDPSS